MIYTTVMNNPNMDNAETKNRRLRLNELIRVCFDDRLVNLIDHIQNRCPDKKRPNQGELSSLRKMENVAKSFGYTKAGNLAAQIGLNRRWFEFPPGTNLDRENWLEDKAITNAYGVENKSNSIVTLHDAEWKPPTAWPFRRVTHDRVMALTQAQRDFIEGALLMAIATCEAESTEKRKSRTRSAQRK